mmetsp:Transcript_33370/g.35909  ORF Transcript_33370/g.35909 Transcript_33370/m.35909 type:complete len:176 (+) Transcript_33370:252-779(+)
MRTYCTVSQCMNGSDDVHTNAKTIVKIDNLKFQFPFSNCFVVVVVVDGDTSNDCTIILLPCLCGDWNNIANGIVETNKIQSVVFGYDKYTDTVSYTNRYTDRQTQINNHRDHNSKERLEVWEKKEVGWIGYYNKSSCSSLFHNDTRSFSFVSFFFLFKSEYQVQLYCIVDKKCSS